MHTAATVLCWVLIMGGAFVGAFAGLAWLSARMTHAPAGHRHRLSQATGYCVFCVAVGAIFLTVIKP